MIQHLARYRMPALIGGAALVVVLVVLLAWVLPEGHRLSGLDTQKQTLALQEQTLQSDIVGLQHDQTQQVANCKTLDAMLQEVPPALDQSQFVAAFSKLAQRSGAATPSLTWGASTTGAAGVDSVAVTLTLQGTFGQVMSFVQGLDGSAFTRLFTVGSFSVGAAGTGAGTGSSGSGGQPVVIGTSLQSASAPSYQVSLAGHIYYAPSQHNACAVK